MLSLMLYAGSTNAHLQRQQDGQLRKAALQDGQPDGQPDRQPDGQQDGQSDGQHEGQQKNGVLPHGQQEDAHQDPPTEMQNIGAGQYISLVNVLGEAVHKVALCTHMNVPITQCRLDSFHACRHQLACTELGVCNAYALECCVLAIAPSHTANGTHAASGCRGFHTMPNGLDFSFLSFLTPLARHKAVGHLP